MDVEQIFQACCGFEDDGTTFTFYFDGPYSEPSVACNEGVRTPLYRLFSGQDAETIRQWLRGQRAWNRLRIPADYTRAKGIQAIRIATDWNDGQWSPLYSFASTRTIHGEDHREALR